MGKCSKMANMPVYVLLNSDKMEFDVSGKYVNSCYTPLKFTIMTPLQCGLVCWGENEMDGRTAIVTGRQ